MTALLLRLAFAGIRSRLLASALTVTIAGTAAATIVLGLEVRASGADPWQRTFAAANGAHVLASVPTRAEAASIARLPGVSERAKPVPLVSATLVTPRGSDPIMLTGWTGTPRVNRPVSTAGHAPGQDGIVLERSIADALGITIGTRVDVRSRETTDVRAELEPTDRSSRLRLPVLGTAISPAQARYPRSTPGVAWASEGVLER